MVRTQELDRADVTVVSGDADKCEEAMRTFPDRVIALGVLSYDDDSPELVDEFHRRGFRG